MNSIRNKIKELDNLKLHDNPQEILDDVSDIYEEAKLILDDLEYCVNNGLEALKALKDCHYIEVEDQYNSLKKASESLY